MQLIINIINPPTPADARGSAPGNNTFDPCFGLLPLLQQLQQQQQPAAAGVDGVFPSGSCFLNGRSRSSRTKKELKSSFSMGFRSYFRQFWGAILMLLPLLRPSLPWCFLFPSGSCLLNRSSSSGNRTKE